MRKCGISGLLCSLCLLMTSCTIRSLAASDSASEEQNPLVLGYVQTEEENEDCNYDPVKDVPDPFHCPAGTRKTTGDRRCVPCQFDETVKTYQPTDTLCGTCILCPICNPGEVEVQPCTRMQRTVCLPISGEKTPIPIIVEMPTDHLTTRKSTTVTSTVLPSSSPTADDDDDGYESNKDQSSDSPSAWMTIAIVSVSVNLILVGALRYCYFRLKTKQKSQYAQPCMDDDDDHCTAV